MVSFKACKECGATLDEEAWEAYETNGTCPYCGSKTRKFSVGRQMSSSWHVRATVSATMESRWNVLAAEHVISATNILMQAIIVPMQKTAEGHLIEVLAPPWIEIIELLKQDPTIAHKIPAHKWEEIVAAAYKKARFDEVTLTPRSGDYGRDVIAVKKGLGVVRIIDQVKAYKPGHLVGANDVRALMGVLQSDGASKGFLTTTSDFAPKLRDDPLIIPFMPSRLELINGRTLLNRLEELAQTSSS